MRELLAARQPKRTVLVAVIDGGIDTAHAGAPGRTSGLNPQEIARQHVDDDHNGYVDDMHGWNFIGGATAATSTRTPSR